MSSKNKSLKENSISQYKNPVKLILEIDTDDDFRINGVHFLKKEYIFKNIEDAKKEIIEKIIALDYTSSKHNEHKIRHFMAQIQDPAFKKDVADLGVVQYKGTCYEQKNTEVRFGGNHSIKITLD